MCTSQIGKNQKSHDEVKYLGCNINRKGDTTKEIKYRTATCMPTLKSLDIFWRHSDCPKRLKLLVQDAVVRSKLVYGLESAELKAEDKNG